MAGAVARDLISGDAVSPPDRFPKGQSRSIPAMKPALKASPAPVVFRTFTWNASVKNSPSGLTVNAPSPPIREITVRPSTAKAPYGVLPIVFGAEGIEFILGGTQQVAHIGQRFLHRPADIRVQILRLAHPCVQVKGGGDSLPRMPPGTPSGDSPGWYRRSYRPFRRNGPIRPGVPGPDQFYSSPGWRRSSPPRGTPTGFAPPSGSIKANTKMVLLSSTMVSPVSMPRSANSRSINRPP